jgi:hypothetical protein
MGNKSLPAYLLRITLDRVKYTSVESYHSFFILITNLDRITSIPRKREKNKRVFFGFKKKLLRKAKKKY